MTGSTDSRPRRRSAVLTVSSAIVGWAVTTWVGSGDLWPIVPLLSLLVLGVVGGLAARRPLDVLAVAVGGGLGGILTGAIHHLEPGAPDDFLFVFPPFIAGLILAVIAYPAYAVGLSVRPSRRPLAGVGMIVLIAAAWAVAVVRDDNFPISAYWVLDDSTIGVEVGGPPRAWCRVTQTAETAADVLLLTKCLSWSFGPGTAELWRFMLTVELAQPLGDRRVLNSEGVDVRRVTDPDRESTQYP
jgi:hypothetical protein